PNTMGWRPSVQQPATAGYSTTPFPKRQAQARNISLLLFYKKQVTAATSGRSRVKIGGPRFDHKEQKDCTK
ncbi:MAG: hypothetical protein WCH61_08710, partial [bacterium]